MHAGEILPVQIELRRQARARHFRLRVKTRLRALLTLPWHAPYKEAELFIDQNRSWLAEQLAARPRPDSFLEYLRENDSVTIRGRRFQLSFEQSETIKRRAIQMDNDAQSVGVKITPDTSIEDAHIYLDTLKAIAKVQLDLRVCDLAERVRLSIPDVSVRDQESRWGSCSSSGKISLNWRLILLPPAIQDYVIYHELAHLTEMNHSTRFWDLLHTYDPRAGRHDRELNQNWTFLMQFGRV